MKESKLTKIFVVSSVVIALLLITYAYVPFTKGPETDDIEMPYNRILRPAGKLVFFGDSTLENHALDVELSPCGKYLAVEGRFSVVVMDTETDTIIKRFSVRDNLRTINTYSGITWYKDNDKLKLIWGTKENLVYATWNGKELSGLKIFHFSKEGKAKASIPNEVIVSDTENGKELFVALNGNDRLAKIDMGSAKQQWLVPTGIAPYGLVKAKNKIYVTNWAGSVPDEATKSVAGVPWNWVDASVDSVTGVANSGTVSVFDAKSGKLLKEIVTGLHPNDIIASADGKFVYVANGNDDYISVINTEKDEVTEKINVGLIQGDNPYFGDTPNGLALSRDGKILYVALGMDNAVAMIELGSKASTGGVAAESNVKGFIPTGAYPSGIALDEENGKMYVADLEGIGARLTGKEGQRGYSDKIKGEIVSTAGYFNAHRMMAAVSVIPMPDKSSLEAYTKTVKETNRQNRIEIADLLPRKGVKPKPVPERIGEPSVFKHVIYIIKENRTYDQVLGDVSSGDGEPKLCAFGKKVTPNIHKLVRQYVLLDRYEAAGKSSSEGHVWTDASIVPDYIEKNVRGWFRSYTHVLYDAMAYPKTGFIWDNALNNGKSVRIYGEASFPFDDGNSSWKDIYHAFLNGDTVKFTNRTTIDRVRGVLSPTYPAYDSHRYPDILRADAFIKELKAFEKMDGDKFPNLIVMALPNDHTAGTAPGYPTPRAMVADNDLALGRIVEAVSRSRFWKNTVIFVTEDDSQNGWDHVSAYRTVGMVISPWSKQGKTVSTKYNQTCLVRTIEQILGLPPMNIADATALPMFDAFTDKADFAVYKHVKNKIPLDEMNPVRTALAGKDLYYAMESARLVKKGIDTGEDGLMNRIIWSSLKNGREYPEKYAGKDEDDDDDD